MEKLLQRFFAYNNINSQSKLNTQSVPSSEGQSVLAKQIIKELTALELANVMIDSYGTVSAKLPSNVSKRVPTIAFISHLDTSPYLAGTVNNAAFIHNYYGNDIVLSESDEVLSLEKYPILQKLLNKNIIASDGRGSLGAICKVAIAEIITAVECIQKQKIPHGDVYLIFLADQQLLRPLDQPDFSSFAIDYAYSVDYPGQGYIGIENINLTKITLKIIGRNTSQYLAKNAMVNALNIMTVIQQSLPKDKMMESTSYFEGFFALKRMEGTVEYAEMEYHLCDFSLNGLQKNKQVFANIINAINTNLPSDCSILIEFEDIFYNYADELGKHQHIIDITKQAMIVSNIKPEIISLREEYPINAKISGIGIPCFALSNGGYNFNSRHEFVVVEEMEKAVTVLQKIVQFMAESV